jgi:transposase
VTVEEQLVCALAQRDEALAALAQRDALIAELSVKVEQVLKQNAELQVRVEALEGKLAQNSSNSSKPPSSDPPWQSGGGDGPPSGRPRKKKRRGFWRKRALPSEVDHFVSLLPTTCRCCGRALRGIACGEPHRHQVTEIPRVSAFITEYQLHALRCERCDAVTRAELPSDVGRSWFGKNLTGLVTMLASDYRLSKRQIQSLIEAQYGVHLSRGEIGKMEKRMGKPLQAPYEEACAHIRGSPVVSADETPWAQRHDLHWLWTAGTKQVVVFRIEKHRDGDAAKALLSEKFGGFLNSDRYGAYGFVPMERRQVCWSHLEREFVELSELKEPVAKYVAPKILDRIADLFSIWRDYQKGTLDRQQMQVAIRPVCRDIESLIEIGAKASHAYTRSKCRSILKYREAFFAFVEHEGVEPTNNRSERNLRHGVIYRKLSHGTQSDEGSRYIERALTVVATLKAQGKDVYAYLIATAQAAFQGTSAPSLLPA